MQTKTINNNGLNIQILKNEQNLNQMLTRIQKSSFIDPEFTHTYQKIYPKQLQINKTHHVIWTPCEQLHHNPFYSEGDFTLKQIKNFNFITSKINIALIIMKYFTSQIFHKLVKERQLYLQLQNKKIKHIFSYDVFLSKQRKKIIIDSYVPVSQQKNLQLFAQNRKGCIFPCLIQKLFAKICNGYYKINNLDICQMLQILTGYPKQERLLKQWKKEKMSNIDLSKVEEFIDNKVSVQRSLVFFRTRKNNQLLSFGLRPGYLYLIIRLSNVRKREEKDSRIVTFLQYVNKQRNIDENQLGWIGKYSKYRLNKKLHTQQNLDQQLRNHLNFISLKDMVEVSQSFVILHNTNKYQTTHYLNLFSQGLLLPNYLSKNKLNKNFFNQNQSNNLTNQNKQNLIAIKKKQLYTYQECLNMEIKNILFETTNKNKILLNFRIIINQPQTLTVQQFKNNTNLTILIWNQNHKTIVYSTNVKPKFKLINKQVFFDMLIEIDQSSFMLNFSQTSIKLITKIYLDILDHEKEYQNMKMSLKVSKYQQVQRNKEDNGMKIQISERSQKQIRLQKNVNINKVSQQNTIFNIVKSLMLKKQITINNNNKLQQTQTNRIQNLSPVQIICSQFIDELNIGVIYLKLTNFESKIKTQSLVVHQNLSTFTKIQLNHQILLKNGLYLWTVNSNKDVDRIESQKNGCKESWKLCLNDQYPQCVILFKIFLENSSLSIQQNIDKKMTFPPQGSVKITRIIDMIV